MQEFYIWYKSKTQCTCCIQLFPLHPPNFVPAFKLLAVTHFSGGKLYVVGIFFGLIFALFTACFSFNVYMQYCLNITPLSFPFFTKELNLFMHDSITANFSTCYIIGMLVVIFSFYVCV
jgi:hypothetical protein